MAINSGSMCRQDPWMIEPDQIFHPGQLSSSTSVSLLFISFHNHSVVCFFSIERWFKGYYFLGK
jgi:hypothetical protein